VEAKARVKFIRVAPRKVRRILDIIRGKGTEEALSILKFTPGTPPPIIEKLLKSAIANSKVKENLYVAQAICNQGPTLARWRPRAMGRAAKIRKKTSHISIVVKERPARPSAPSAPRRRTPKKSAGTSQPTVRDHTAGKMKDKGDK
jgi:large subunit ribosomal protein L22